MSNMPLTAVLFISSCILTAAAFVVLPSSSPKLSSRLFEATDSAAHDGSGRRRLAEFGYLEPLLESQARRERLDREKENEGQFAKYGNDLWDLRGTMNDLSNQLVEAINSNAEETENDIRRSLRKVERRDPELVYRTELEAMHDAARDGRTEDEIFHKGRALNARSCLPHFNLEGLWVGKYGSHGYEMINVTYAGDTLIAFKVTGDQNVPRGEITFQADLNPLALNRISRSTKPEPLSPIMLTDKASKKWGTTQLPRYHGLGRVAEENFQNSQWMEGQLIIIGEEYFSFAWVPIEHQIFFGRPSPELALKMLRDGGVSVLKDKAWNEPPTQDDDVTVWKDFATHCFEKTEEKMEEEMLGDFGCIWHGVTEECYFQ